MKAWKIKVKNNQQEIIKKLTSALGSVNGFVFNVDHAKTDSIGFSFRKRVLYPDQILHRNRVNVNGKILKTVVENETDVDISFTQHFLVTLNIALFIGFGLFAIILGIGGSTSAYMVGSISLAVGVAFWISARQKFNQELQKYKTLITEILEL